MDDKRAAQEAAGMFDVTDFGASPDADGKTNLRAIRAAIEAALAHPGAGESVVWFPSGHYSVDDGEAD